MSKATVLVRLHSSDKPKQFTVNDYINEITVRDNVLYIDHGTITGFPLTSVDQFSIDKI